MPNFISLFISLSLFFVGWTPQEETLTEGNDAEFQRLKKTVEVERLEVEEQIKEQISEKEEPERLLRKRHLKVEKRNKLSPSGMRQTVS